MQQRKFASMILQDIASCTDFKVNLDLKIRWEL